MRYSDDTWMITVKSRWPVGVEFDVDFAWECVNAIEDEYGPYPEFMQHAGTSDAACNESLEVLADMRVQLKAWHDEWQQRNKELEAEEEWNEGRLF